MTLRPKSPNHPVFQWLASPVLVTALLWVGLQSIVLLYLGSLLGDWARHLPLVTPEHDLAPLIAPMRWINFLFVVLLWIRFRSVPRPGRRDWWLSVAGYAGTALLLGLIQWAWEILPATELPIRWGVEKVPL